MELHERKAFIEKKFIELYDKHPTLWVQAPGRVDLMGSHTDYNDGYVLTEAINRNTWIAAYPRDDEHVRICSLNTGGCSEFTLSNITLDNTAFWSNYVRGVAHIMQQNNCSLRGFDGLIHSTIPFSSGLSSSAALEVATAIIFDKMSNLNTKPISIAKMSQRAENEFVGMSCGILDQFSSVMGLKNSVLLLDCRDLTSQTIPLADGIQVVVCDTKTNRNLTKTEFSLRRRQCEWGAQIFSQIYPEVTALRDVSLEKLLSHKTLLTSEVYKRCKFVIEENQRVLDFSHALSEGDFDEISSITFASYIGARDLFEIYSTEMEKMMNAMLSGPGVIGARQAGAGFGGCMIAFVEQGQLEAFSQFVSEKYNADVNIQPDIYSVEAANGAGEILDIIGNNPQISRIAQIGNFQRKNL